ncbi:MAG: hypothetical protein ABIK09_20740 [Pseudomonadota bacterium]
MRTLTMVALAATIFLAAPQAEAASLTDNPHSVGLGIGLSTYGSLATFAMEIPYEYTFKVGPGLLAIHAGFFLAAHQYFVGIGIPIGARYKFQITKHPLYVGPTFDIGPIFGVSTSGNSGASSAGGLLRIGGIVSYLVHPKVEAFFQPVGIGATFGAGSGAFSYTMLMGAQYRF